MDYWIVANSWSADWGESGYFKIRRGTNECGIEANALAGLADLNGISGYEEYPGPEYLSGAREMAPMMMLWIVLLIVLF